MIRNERKWFQHICAKCWTSSLTITRHTEFSEDCSGISASHLRAPLEPPRSTSAWLLSGTVFSHDNSFIDFHDSRLFKTFSPVVDSSLCSSVASCHASYSCSGPILDLHGFDTTLESQCLLSDSRLSVLDSWPSATSAPGGAFGLSSGYFSIYMPEFLHLVLTTLRVFVYQCHCHFVCLFGEHIYKSMAVMEFVIFWSLVGQLVSTIPVLFQYTLTFTITRVSQTSQMLLILICRQRLRSTGLLVRFLIFNIQLQINK